VINVHYVMPTGFAGLFAQKVSRIPAVITYNGRDVPGPEVPPLWKYWHRIIGRNCSDMTFVSKYCRDVIYGSNSSSGHLIYNGVEDPVPVSSEQVSALKSKFEISDDEHVLFSLQRLDFLKRIDVIIRSMPEILDKRPNTRLIIGGKGPDLSRLQSMAAELGVDKHLVFPGFIPETEVPVYHTAADLFIFHSTYETFGIVLAEAMNYGTPVVSVDNTAIPEVVDQGQTGLLVPTFDHKALADAVLQLLTDRRCREEMGKRAKEKASRVFNWDLNSQRYESVLQYAAKGSSFHSGSQTDL
jgi:phosphatidylinositol alpha-1,6-mannosyltransferase